METITGQQIAWISIYIWYKLLQAFLYAWLGEEIFMAVCILMILLLLFS